MIRGKIKAILPLILSVAMTIQSAPVTAFAAPADVDIEQEAIEEIAEEDEAVVDEEILDEAIEEEVVETADEVLTGEGELTGTIVLEQTRATQFTYAGRKYIYDGKSGLSGSYPDGEDLNNIFLGLNDGWDDFVDRISVKLSDKTTSSFGAWDNQTVEYYKSDKTTKLTVAEQANPDAGKYFVKVTAEITGATIAEPLFIPFDINKDDAQIYIDSYGSVQSGLEASKFIEEIKNYLYIESSSFDYALNMFASSINVSIKQDGKEYTGVVADDGSEYVVTVSAVLKDDYAKNYNPVAATVVVDADWFKSPISVTPSVEYKKPAGAKEEDPTPTFIEVDYTGSEIAAPITLPSLSNNSVEVKFEYHDTETGKDVAVPTNKDNLEGIWLDDNGDELAKDEKVIDAGTYYYRVSFKDSTKKFDEALAYIKVVVNPTKLYLKPGVADYVFFAGHTAGTVLDYVNYELYTDEGCTKKAENIDRNTFWGTSYVNENLTQPYSPAFRLQKTTSDKKYSELTDVEKEALSWSTVGTNTKLVATDVKDEDTNKYTYYRIVATGRMYAYNADRTDSTNKTLAPEDKNYGVELVDGDVAALVINVASNIKIDISKIIDAAIDPKKGDTVANRKIKTYDKEMLYNKRADYKLATVSANAAKNGVLSYTWYEYDYIDTETVDGKTVEVYRISDYISDELDYYAPSPKDVGYYGLRINYDDPTGEFFAPTEEVFFEIKPQSLLIQPKSPITVKEKTPAYELLYDREFNVYAVSGNGIVDTKVREDLKVEPYDWTAKYCDNEADKGDITKYTDYRYSAPLEYADGRTHKIADVKFKVYDAITGENLDVNYSYEYETKEGDVVVSKNTSYLKPIDFTVKKIGDKTLTVNVDTDKLDKTYDGTPIDVAAGIKFEDSEGKPVDIKATYTWGTSSFMGIAQTTNKAPVDAGYYYLYILYEGDDTYDRLESGSYGVTISPKDVNVNVTIDEKIPAGTYHDVVPKYAAVTEPVAGIVDKDKDKIELYVEGGDLYTNGKSYNSYLVYNSSYEFEPTIIKEMTSPDDGLYDYYDYYDGYKNPETGLVYDPCDNYNLTSDAVGFKVTTRGLSQVNAAEYYWGDCDYPEYSETIEGFKHTITPDEAIEYKHRLKDYNNDEKYDEDGNSYEGNYFAVQINKPSEYYAYSYDCGVDNQKRFDYRDFLYKNSLKAAGGILLYEGGNFIQVAFDAADKKDKKFDITWEEGFTETYEFVFANAVLGIDKTLAVAPKSLAFNNPVKTMAVGESQALDVKYTKELYKDVVILNYEAVTEADKKILAVDKTTGRVTAITKGKATVEVYPVREDKEGKLVKIEGAKTAKVIITVKDVDMPKISKVTAGDDSVSIIYNKVSNGYRREIYVAEGKKDVKFFEDELLTIKDNNFATSDIVKVQYYANDRGKGKIDPALVLNGLAPNTEYTVYVRNVSGLRRVGPDNIWVADSHQGSVKTFKTTKPDAEALCIGISDIEKNKGIEFNEYMDFISVPYSVGKTKVDIYAMFKAMYADNAADYDDMINVLLPATDRTIKNTYNVPKLKVTAYSYYIDDKDYEVSKIVKMDAKGNITLKGVGYAYILIEDTVSNKTYDFTVESFATPSKVTAKNIKLRVGEILELAENDFLTYYVGNKKVLVDGGMIKSSYYDTAISTSVADEEYLKLIDYDYRPGTYNTDLIESIKDGARAAKVAVVLNDYPTVKTEFTVDTTSLTKVSNLKVVDIVDYTGQVTFTYPDLDVEFKVDLFDNRGNLEASKIIYLGGDWFDETDDDDLYRWDYDYRYNKAKKYYEYNFDIDDVFSGDIAEYYYKKGYLSRKSNYKISVTPVRKHNGAKGSELLSGSAVSTKFKTTDIPAAYDVLGPKETGGMSIERVNSNGWYGGIDDGFTIKSGNQIILKPVVTDGAEYTGSDVLTWTVDNKKVATVKANPGTNTVTITAVSAGDFTLSVKSKITGKTVARYNLKVSPVENADAVKGGTGSWLDYDYLTPPLY